MRSQVLPEYQPPVYELIPEGWHNFVIKSGDERVSKKGNPYILIKANITRGKYGYLFEVLLTDPKSPPLSVNGKAFVEQRMEAFKQAIGVDKIDAFALSGMRFSANIKHDEYEGEQRAKVKGAFFKPFDQELDDAKDRIKAKENASKGKPGVDLDDDIPF